MPFPLYLLKQLANSQISLSVPLSSRTKRVMKVRNNVDGRRSLRAIEFGARALHQLLGSLLSAWSFLRAVAERLDIPHFLFETKRVILLSQTPVLRVTLSQSRLQLAY